MTSGLKHIFMVAGLGLSLVGAVALAATSKQPNDDNERTEPQVFNDIGPTLLKGVGVTTGNPYGDESYTFDTVWLSVNDTGDGCGGKYGLHIEGSSDYAHSDPNEILNRYLSLAMMAYTLEQPVRFQSNEICRVFLSPSRSAIDYGFRVGEW